MRALEVPKKGDPITAEWGEAVTRAINELLAGPNVWSPLVVLEGAIGLGQDYQVYEVVTSGGITARVGTQWGSGNANFITVDASGVETTMLGNAAVVVWNYFGAAIASGIRCQVVWSYDKWVIIGGDCSGVA